MPFRASGLPDESSLSHLHTPAETDGLETAPQRQESLASGRFTSSAIAGTHLAIYNRVMTTRARAIVIRPVESGWVNLGAHLRRLFEYADLLRTLSIHRI